jgi:hypothetical protein
MDGTRSLRWWLLLTVLAAELVAPGDGALGCGLTMSSGYGVAVEDVFDSRLTTAVRLMQNRRAVLGPRQPVATAEEGPTVPRRAPSPVVVEVRRDGFHWTDAGVGALAALALVAIAFGVALVVRGRPDTPPATWEAES